MGGSTAWTRPSASGLRYKVRCVVCFGLVLGIECRKLSPMDGVVTPDGIGSFMCYHGCWVYLSWLVLMDICIICNWPETGLGVRVRGPWLWEASSVVGRPVSLLVMPMWMSAQRGHGRPEPETRPEPCSPATRPWRAGGPVELVWNSRAPGGHGFMPVLPRVRRGVDRGG